MSVLRSRFLIGSLAIAVTIPSVISLSVASLAIAAAVSTTPPAALSARDVLSLDGAPSDLTVDPLTGRIWFVVPRSEDGTLYSFDPGTSTSRRWSLPPGDYYGAHFQIKAASTGVVWFKSSYVLGRVDPRDWSLATALLADSASDELEAGSGAAYLEGTWMSAIAPDGDGVIVARNNVPHLERYDSKLKLSGSTTIPHAYAGAWDIVADKDGLLLQQSVLHPSTMIGRLSNDGSVLNQAPSQGRRILDDGKQLWTVGWGPGTVMDRTTMSVAPRIASIPAAAARGKGDEIVAYDAAANQLSRYRGGKPIAQAKLGTYRPRIHAYGSSGVASEAPASIIAMTVAGDDGIWFFAADKPNVLQRASL